MEKPEQQQAPPDSQKADAPDSNFQRNPARMLNVNRGNTEVRDGKCYVMRRSQMDPRWPQPQFIDETICERNRLHSLNLQRLNPDVPELTSVKCICSKYIHLKDDWYVMTHDGTILCNNCTRCFRCFMSSSSVARKVNCIDGFVLCNPCMLSYGSYREKFMKLKVQGVPKSLDDYDAEMKAKEQAGGQENNANTGAPAGEQEADPPKRPSESLGGRPAENLDKPRFRDEGRRPIRLIPYPNPRPANYGRPDRRFEPPPYMGVDRNEGCAQACPECGQQAHNQALVVPSIGRVFHERSFRCEHCKRPMHMGYQVPTSQFEACSCPKQTKVWCTGRHCRLARVAHHTDKGCHLAPVHPGGRPLCDVPGLATRFEPAVSRAAMAKMDARANPTAGSVFVPPKQ